MYNTCEMSFKYYPVEKLIIESIYSRLTKQENDIRINIMKYTIDNNKAYNLEESYEEIQSRININKYDLNQVIKNLIQKKALVVDENNNVNFIYPVSTLETNHKVKLEDESVFNAMCAVDAMGSSFTFKQDIEIQSKCSLCGEEIFVEIKNGEIVNLFPDSTHVLHVDLNKNQNWSGNC